MQTDLRMILLVVGFCIIVGIIIDGLRRRKEKSEKTHTDLNEFDEVILTKPDKNKKLNIKEVVSEQELDPLLENFSFDTLKENQFIENSSSNQEEVTVFTAPKKPLLKVEPTIDNIVAITILSTRPTGFSGRSLQSAFKSNELYRGDTDIFYKYLNNDLESEPLFNVASIVEPGTFDVNNMHKQFYHGIVLFMILPLSHEPLKVFAQMLETANNLRYSLNGQLCDSKRIPLTNQSIEHYKEQIVEFSRKQLYVKGFES